MKNFDLIKSIIIKLSTPRLCVEETVEVIRDDSDKCHNDFVAAILPDDDVLNDFLNNMKENKEKAITFCELQAFLNTNFCKDFLRDELGFLCGNFLFAFKNDEKEVFIPHLKHPRDSIYLPYVFPRGCGSDDLKKKMYNFIIQYQKDQGDIIGFLERRLHIKFDEFLSGKVIEPQKLENIYDEITQYLVASSANAQEREKAFEAITEQYLQILEHKRLTHKLGRKYGVVIWKYDGKYENSEKNVTVEPISQLLTTSAKDPKDIEHDQMVAKWSVCFVVPAIVGTKDNQPMCLCYASFNTDLDESNLATFLEIGALLAAAAVNGPIAAKMQQATDDMIYLVNIIKDFPHINLKYINASMALCYLESGKQNNKVWEEMGDNIKRFVEAVALYLQWRALKTLKRPVEDDFKPTREDGNDDGSFNLVRVLEDLKCKLPLFLDVATIFSGPIDKRMALWSRMIHLEYESGLKHKSVKGLKGAFYILMQNLIHNTITKGLGNIREGWNTPDFRKYLLDNCPFIHIHVSEDPTTGMLIMEYYDSAAGFPRCIMVQILDWIKGRKLKGKQGFGFQTMGLAANDLSGILEITESEKLDPPRELPEKLRENLSNRFIVKFKVFLNQGE